MFSTPEVSSAVMNAAQSSYDLVLTQLRLKCIGLNADGRLIRLPCATPYEPYRVYIARHSGGFYVFFRADLPEAVVERLLVLPTHVLFHNRALVREALSQDAPCEVVRDSRSYLYPAEGGMDDLPGVVRQPNNVCEVWVDGVKVCTAMSGRENDEAAEVWVLTDPEHRKKGYARMAVQAWAQRVRAQGKMVFYNHRYASNHSRRLAESLGFQWFMDDVGYL